VAPSARTTATEPSNTHDELPLSAPDIGRRAAAGAALLTAKGTLAQVLGLLSTIVVTRLLVPHQLGLYAIALSISAFLLLVGSGVGTASALIRRPTAPEHADLRAYAAFQLVASTVLSGIVILATRPFGSIGDLTAVMILSAPIVAFRGAGLIVLERQLLYKRITAAETAEMVTYYAWTIATVVIGWGVWGLATATVARAVVGTAFILALAPTGIVWPRWDRARIRAILGIGLRVQAVDLVAALRDQILVLGTAVVGSVTVVAYWSLILRIVQAPQSLLMQLVRVSFPAMSRIRSGGGDPAGLLPQILPAATIVTGILLAPLAAAPALVPLLFGEKWAPAAGALTLVCLAVIIHTPMVIACQSYLWTAGDAKTPLRAQIADFVVVVGVGLPLVPVIGVLGLAIGGVACAIANTAVLARTVDRETHVNVVRHIRGPVLSWILAAGLAWACAQAPGPLVVRAALSVCVAVGVYVGLLFLTRRELMLGLARNYGPLVHRRFLRRGSAVRVEGRERTRSASRLRLAQRERRRTPAGQAPQHSPAALRGDKSERDRVGQDPRIAAHDPKELRRRLQPGCSEPGPVGQEAESRERPVPVGLAGRESGVVEEADSPIEHDASVSQ
jgi:O-antigen/teichoic acid export membrane protein